MPPLAVFVKAVFSGNLYRALVSLRARVAEKHIYIARRFAERLGEIRLHLCVVVIRCVLELADLPANRLYPVLIAVAEGVRADPRAKVYIPLAVFVRGVFALSAVHYQRISSVGGHYILVELLDSIHNILSRVQAIIIVPAPVSVRSSISIEWGIRPSMMLVLRTPRRTASTQQSILGIIPPEIMPCLFR